jgi:ATP-dependent helicase HrpA
VAEIERLWRDHPVIIVGGATGSGKTTQLPKIALEIGRGRQGRIGCTQPRRIAASAMARRVAQELSVECGEAVGYQVRFDNRTASSTVIKFMTDGILLAETAADRKLRQYDTLIIDEAHERSLNIDFLLGYLKNLLPARPDLKIAISSATLDLEAFSRFFDGAPIVEVEGRMFPVEDIFLPPEDADEELPDQVARAVNFLSELDRHGDMLVFLPGEREIRDCTELLTGRKLPNTEVLPLYSRLGAQEQQRVFKPGRLRRIILATNVAETSITIPRIRFCIDSGLARISRYNPRTRIQELQIETISQASVRQRRGRCGRVADGVCAHLYSEDDLARSPGYTDPEIRRTSLAGVILQMAALKLPKISHFPFIDPPPPALIREGMHTLEDIRAVLPGGKLTPDGWTLAALPIDPHLGKMLLEAERLKVLPELLIICAGLSIADPRERPADKQQQADEQHRKFRDEKSDFIGFLRLWAAITAELGENPSHGALRRFCRTYFLNYNRISEWRNLAADLEEACRENRRSDPAKRKLELDRLPYDQIHMAILAGIPRNIAKYVPEYRYFLGTGGRKFDIFPGSGLFKRKNPPPWLLTFALVETSRLFGRNNAEIKPEYLEAVAPHLCVSVYERPAWDEATGFVHALEKLTFGGLVIHAGRRVHYGKTHPKEAREIFIRDALAPGNVDLPGTWAGRHCAMLRELEALEIKVRRPDSIVDGDAIFEHFMLLLPPEALSVDSLKQLIRRDPADYSMNRADAMQTQYIEFDERDYPDELVFSGHRFRLQYRFDPGEEDDGVTLLVPEKELNLLPGWALDYPAPGYLAEKVEAMLRALPKTIRQRLSPLADCAADFAAKVKSGDVFAGQPLVDALLEYLAGSCEVNFAANLFEAARLPEHLRLKIALLNEKNQVKAILRELPERRNLSSQLSHTVAGVAPLVSGGGRTWPGDALPPEVELPGAAGKTAFPALTDEGDSVGRQLFLKRAEALHAHRRGLIRLFRLGQANQVKFIRRTLEPARELKLAWFVHDREQRAADDLLDAAIVESFGVELWSIRDRQAFEVAAERAKQEVGEASNRLAAGLIRLHQLYLPVDELTDKLKRRPGVDARDLRRQLDFLFAPDFLRRPAVWSDYPRYLRGLKIRAERFGNNPAKDAEKFAALAPWIERFELATRDVADLTRIPDLYDFWLLLEECRLSCFAPEVPVRIKNPTSRLEPDWNQLRI